VLTYSNALDGGEDLGKRWRIFFQAIRKMSAMQIAIYVFLIAVEVVCVFWALHNFHVIP